VSTHIHGVRKLIYIDMDMDMDIDIDIDIYTYVTSITHSPTDICTQIGRGCHLSPNVCGGYGKCTLRCPGASYRGVVGQHAVSLEPLPSCTCAARGFSHFLVSNMSVVVQWRRNPTRWVLPPSSGRKRTKARVTPSRRLQMP
jgi:hypothetical protein